MEKTFFEWVKDPQAELKEKQRLGLIQKEELDKKKRDEQRRKDEEEKRKRDSDDISFLAAII